MSTPAVPTDSTSHPRLERPVEDRKVSGVCAAVARQWRIDVRLVRVGAILLALTGGLGFVLYLAGLLLIPGEGAAEPLIREGVDGPERKFVIVFGALAVISVLDLTTSPWHVFHGPGWPLVAVLCVAAVALLAGRESDGGTAVPVMPVAPPAPADPDPDDADRGEDPTLVGPPPAGEPPPPPKPRGRSAMILGATMLVLAVIGAVLAAAGSDLRWDIALCAAVIAIGVGLVISAPLGGARILIPFGLLLALLAGGAAAADLQLKGGVGDHLERPAVLPAGATEYHLSAGRLVVDLRDTTLAPGVTHVKAELGFGQLVVRLPAGVRGQVKAHASAGEIEALGRQSDGLDAHETITVTSPRSGPVLTVDAHTGFGQVRVVRAAQAIPAPGDHTITNGGTTR